MNHHSAQEEFAVIVTALNAGKIGGPDAVRACVAVHARLAAEAVRPFTLWADELDARADAVAITYQDHKARNGACGPIRSLAQQIRSRLPRDVR